MFLRTKHSCWYVLLCDAGDVGCPFEVIREMKSKIFVGFGSSTDSFMDGVFYVM